MAFPRHSAFHYEEKRQQASMEDLGVAAAQQQLQRAEENAQRVAARRESNLRDVLARIRDVVDRTDPGDIDAGVNVIEIGDILTDAGY